MSSNAHLRRSVPLTPALSRKGRGGLSAILLTLLAVSFAHAEVVDPRPSAAAAFAAPMQAIKVDGKLDDWPESLPRYAITNTFGVYGPTDLDGADLLDSADCQASFRVGYNARDNRLYLAVTVRDDQHVLGSNEGSNFERTDALEVYLDPPHHRGPGNLAPGQPDVQALQWAFVAGDGVYMQGTNPALWRLDIRQSRTEFAHSRMGDVTTYEIALEAHDEFPAQATTLAGGKRMGLEVVVVDKDSPTVPAAWVIWGPIGSSKALDASLLGDLVLLGEGDTLREVSGVVTRDDGKPAAKLWLDVFRGEDPAGVMRTDERGRYRLHLPAGDYTIRPQRFAGVNVGEPSKVTVADKPVTADLRVTPLAVPPALARAIDAYAKLKTYRDTTRVVITGETNAGASVRHEMALDFASERPGRVRIASDSPALSGLRLWSDGQAVNVTYLGVRGGAGGQGSAPIGGAVALHDFAELLKPVFRRDEARLRTRGAGGTGYFGVAGFAGNLLVQRLVMRGTPVEELVAHSSRIEERGGATVGEQGVTIVEIERNVAQTVPDQQFYSSRRGEPLVTRLWIADATGLILRTSFDMDLTLLRARSGGEGEEPPPEILTIATQHENITVDRPLPAETFGPGE
jgi:hypothetical protein